MMMGGLGFLKSPQNNERQPNQEKATPNLGLHAFMHFKKNTNNSLRRLIERCVLIMS